MAGTLRSACNSGTGAEATPSTAAIARWLSATPLHRASPPCALPIHILRTCKCRGIQPIGSLVACGASSASPERPAAKPPGPLRYEQVRLLSEPLPLSLYSRHAGPCGLVRMTPMVQRTSLAIRLRAFESLYQFVELP